jgi:hypothetical protein
MEIAKLLLEYLRVFLTWPPLLALVLFYLMTSQKTAITRLIDRIKQVNFPGGGIEAEYPELPKEKSEQAISPPSPEESRSSPQDLLKKIDALDQDFDKYLRLNLQANKKIIANILAAIWRKSGGGLLTGLVSRGEMPGTFLEKIQALRDRIDPRALEDLEYLARLDGKQLSSRRELMQACIKSKLLVDYLRGLATRG